MSDDTKILGSKPDEEVERRLEGRRRKNLEYLEILALKLGIKKKFEFDKDRIIDDLGSEISWILGAEYGRETEIRKWDNTDEKGASIQTDCGVWDIEIYSDPQVNNLSLDSVKLEANFDPGDDLRDIQYLTEEYNEVKETAQRYLDWVIEPG